MSYCLIVEDNLISCEVFSEHLEGLGVESKVAHHANDAVELCKEQMPVAIILDWHMPDIDGLQFAKILREMDGGDLPHLLICSCDEGVRSHPDVADLNVADYLSKPTYLVDIFRSLDKLGLVDHSEISANSLKFLEKQLF